MTALRTIFVIAGPNGAGKTTFAREFLPNEGACPIFVNADLIAEELSPLRPEAAGVRAGRLMLAQIDDHVRRGDSFAFETTLSGRAYLKRIRDWQKRVYRIELVFLSLPTADMAIARVAERVALGGHDVPPDRIRRRFATGRQHFERLYKPLVDRWYEYDCAGRFPRLVCEGGR